MKKPIFYLVLFFSCSFLNPAKSQVLADDSLALLDLYLETDGPNWTNNQNWLNGPVNTWFGITVEFNRVTKVELPSNNLMGLIPASFNDLTALRELVLNNNGITAIADLTNLSALSRFIVNNNRLEDLPALLSSILGEVNCANNALNFADLEPLGIFPINNFVYAPQANVGQEGFLYAQEGATFQIPGEGESTNNLYRWFKDGNQISGPVAFPDLTIVGATEADEGSYHVEITNNNLPLLTLSSHPVHLLLYEEDSLGGEFVPNHLIVEFTDEATQFEKDTLLEYYQAERLDTCLCGIIELWELPDTSVLPGGEILVGVEESKQDARAKSEIEDAGNNYLMELLIEKAKIKPFFKPKLPKEPLPDNIIIRNETVPTVAIIDVGIDYNHPSLTPYIWSNAAEIVDGEDNDGNCLIDDARGYNFTKDNNDALDMTNGHGTHVAGIVVENIPVGDVELINIKSHGDDGVGLLFEALCGIYYAAEKEANVINLSWGYRGVASSVLESAIARAGADCGSLVVTSAGNEGLNTDELPHYPSSYELENLIAVAALNETEDALSPESNYGPASVHLAAPGTRIFSTVPGGGFDFKSGTSMAAAAVSNVAAQLCAANPEATYANIKTAILNTVLELVSLEDLSTGGKLNTEAALEFIAFVEADTSCFLVDLLPEVSYSNLKAKAYPQPFHDKVFLELPLEKSSLFQISIFNLVGELVFSGTELLGPDQSGFSWDGRRANSIALPPGIYIAQLQTNHIRFITQLVKI